MKLLQGPLESDSGQQELFNKSTHSWGLPAAFL